MSTLNSGLWYSSSSDPYLLDAPWVDLQVYCYEENQYIAMRLGSGGCLISPSDPDLTYFYYQSIANPNLQIKLDFDGAGVQYRFDPDDYEITEPPYPYSFSDRFGKIKWDEDKELYNSPVCYQSNTYFNRLFWEYDDGKPTREEYLVEGWTPYMWQDLDLAQYIYAFTKFYSYDGNGTSNVDNMLSMSGLTTYSSNVHTTYCDSITLDYWRHIGESLSETVKDMIEQTGALATFEYPGSTGAITNKLNIYPALSYCPVIDTSYDLEDADNVVIHNTPQLTDKHDHLANSYSCTWGSFSITEKPTDISGDAHATVTLESPGSAGGDKDSNKFELSASESVVGYGKKSVSLEAKFIQDDHKASAVIYNRLQTELGSSREIIFEMGPQHYNFIVGDIIELSYDPLDIDSQKFVVTKKVYSWDDHSAKIYALEYFDASTEFRVDVDSTQNNINNKLALWLRAEHCAGTTTSTHWDDSSDYGTLRRLEHISGWDACDLGSVTISGIEYHYVDFGDRDDNRGFVASGLSPTNNETYDGYTYFAVVCPNDDYVNSEAGYVFSTYLEADYSSNIFGGVAISSQLWADATATADYKDVVYTEDKWQIVAFRGRANNSYYNNNIRYNNAMLECTEGGILTTSECQFNSTALTAEENPAITFNPDANLYIGTALGLSLFCWSGKMAELAIYDETLTPFEYQAILNGLKYKYRHLLNS